MKRFVIPAAFALVVGSGPAMASPETVVTTALQSTIPPQHTAMEGAPCRYGDCAVPQRIDSQIRGPWENSLRYGSTLSVNALRRL
jgi:hypothetical protein